MSQDVTDVVYRIDSANRITGVGEGWSEFARSNAGFELTASSVVGSSLTSWISDATTREVYLALLTRIRERRDPVTFNFRCDGPVVRRLLRMRMAVGNDGEVEFRTSLIDSQPRTAMSLMDSTLIRSESQIKICGWCMRLPEPSGEWVEIERAVHALRFFEGLPVPRLSHTMCPDCFSSMENALERPAPIGGVTFGPLPT